jgi:DNA-binding transcriptional regulator YbjK
MEDFEYLYSKIKDEERSIQSLLDDLYTSTMQKVDELIEDARKLKEKYQS